MKKYLLNNIGWKLLSVVIAILLWLIVLNISDPVDTQIFYNVPVEMTNTNILTEEGKVFDVLDNSANILVRVSAKRSILNNLTKENIRATADFSELTLSNTVGIHLTTTKNANEIDSITSTTEYVKLNVEDVQRKQLVIDMVTTGNPADGYYVGRIVADQNLVRLTGPKSVIDTVSVAQVVVDVTGMKENISTSSELRLYDSAGKQIKNSNITSNLNYVNVNVTILTSKQIPVYYSVDGRPADGYELTGKNEIAPANVTVMGQQTTLAGITFIGLPDALLSVDGMTETFTKEVKITEYLPDGVTLMPGESETVKIVIPIEQVETKEIVIPKENILIEDVPEGYTAELVNYGEYDDLKLSAITSILENQRPEDYRGRIVLQQAIDNDEAVRIEGDEELYVVAVQYTLPDRVAQVSEQYVVIQLIQPEAEAVTAEQEPGEV